MRNIYLLDCTLRDGGYINDWKFGFAGIKAIIGKLEQAGIDMIEVGFLRGDEYDEDKSLFPSVESIKHVITEKSSNVTYVAMLDMNNPIPMERIGVFDNTSIDGIRVIFKKDKLDEAFKTCSQIKQAGYKVFVNFVNTDAYTDKEFIEGIEKFNSINPDGVTIVDTFGTIKRRDFLRLVAIADNNLNPGIMLCYHAHNNLQQAYGNAEALVERGIMRDIIIDACVFGMGRGAGNLNLELFAEFMNDSYGKSYRIEPLLEIMDEYLGDFYRTKFWGYSLPLYLSASHGCHPNYAIYFAEKNTLSEKAFNELLKSISAGDRLIYSKEKAEEYYRNYMQNYTDDKDAVSRLAKKIKGKEILLIAPGSTIKGYKDIIDAEIEKGPVVICVNFYEKSFEPGLVFTSSIRRFDKIVSATECPLIATSNIKDSNNVDYYINYASLTGDENCVYDNSALMALRLLELVGVKRVKVAGMDGYTNSDSDDYYESGFGAKSTMSPLDKNGFISEELKKIMKRIKIDFVTPTHYQVT